MFFKKSRGQPTGATQEFLQIEHVRDGIVEWSDGTYSLIMRVSTINVDLQSQAEQMHIQEAFRRFLDQIDFPFQVYILKTVHSVDEYLGYLRECTKNEFDPHALTMLGIYYDFIRAKGEAQEFFEQEFYIVFSEGVPKIDIPISGLLDGLPFGSKSSRSRSNGVKTSYASARHNLERKAAAIKQGLAPIGIVAEPLGTMEVLELFYSIYAGEHYAVDRAAGLLIDHLSIYSSLADQANATED